MLRHLSGCVAVLAVSMSLCHAADEPASKKKGLPGQQIFQLPKEVELTADQQAKLDALKKEHGPKLAELQKRVDEILSMEQKTARKEAIAKAREEKLKGKEAREALEAALKLTPEQKEKWTAAQAEIQAAQGKVRERIAEFLTDEQKAKVPGLAPAKKKKKAA